MSEKKNKENLKKELEEGFDMFDYKNFGIVNPNELKEIMDAMNLQEKNPFLYNIIDNLSQNEKVNRRGGIDVNEFISIIDNELEDCSSKNGVEKIFSVFSNPISNIVTLPTFLQVAKEIGDDEKEEKIKELIDKGQLTNDEFNFNDFYDVMKTNQKNKENKENNNESKVYVKKSSTLRDNNNKFNNSNTGYNNNENDIDKFDNYNYVNNKGIKNNYDQKNNYYINNKKEKKSDNNKYYKNDSKINNIENNNVVNKKIIINSENNNNNKEDNIPENNRTYGYLKVHIEQKTPKYEKTNVKIVENKITNVNSRNTNNNQKNQEIKREESGNSNKKRKYYRHSREKNKSPEKDINTNENSNNSTNREKRVIRNVIEPQIEINRINVNDKQNINSTKGKLIYEIVNINENKMDDPQISYRQKHTRNNIENAVQENDNKSEDIKGKNLSTDDKIKRYHRRYRDTKINTINNNIENTNVDKKESKTILNNDRDNNNQRTTNSTYLKYKKK